MSLPVSRHATPRSRDRLVDRMVMWRRQLWTVDVLLRRVVEEPVLAGLIALDDGVSAFLRMVARVLGWGGVAATDVTAVRASTKVEPPTPTREALDAARAAGRHRRINIHFFIIPGQAAARFSGQPLWRVHRPKHVAVPAEVEYRACRLPRLLRGIQSRGCRLRREIREAE